MKTLYPEFEDKLREITALSSKINKNDRRRILEMMHAHVEEIEERYKRRDDHWAIETADLIVLCYELLLMDKKDIDEIFARCLPRFDVKLQRLAADVS